MVFSFSHMHPTRIKAIGSVTDVIGLLCLKYQLPTVTSKGSQMDKQQRIKETICQECNLSHG